MAVDTPRGLASTVSRIHELLERAATIKTVTSIDPPLTAVDFIGSQGLEQPSPGVDRISHYGLIELAARVVFHDYISKHNVNSSEFISVWNLLDILAVCGDQEQCDPVLVWWLIEELLESQSIQDCHVVFDFLDSRRERLVTRHFRGKKELVILRSFNELLRRLSRAEDAVFCGRVLIFLSQSSQLGARSATNHKGEFNTENVTAFEDVPATAEVDAAMPDAYSQPEDAIGQTVTVVQDSMQIDTTAEVTRGVNVKEEHKKVPTIKTPVLDSDILYPVFWSLQTVFSNPPLLFEEEPMTQFQEGLDATLRKFRDVPKIVVGVNTAPGTVSQEDDASGQNSAFNPKYLTSKDLFKLELSDLTFQRDILVQALILIDFLLSLAEKSKAKPSYLQAQNKAVQYSFTLTDHDEEWLTRTKGAIALYLREGPEGTYFYRMVDTVLSRDKNWVRWKLDNCPDIRKDRVPSVDYGGATEKTKKVCVVRTLRATPMGSLNLSFMDESGEHDSLDRLQDPYHRTTSFELSNRVNLLSQTDLDLELAQGDEKDQLTTFKEAQYWSVLRDATKTDHAFSQLLNVTSPVDAEKLKMESSMTQLEDMEHQPSDIAVDASEAIPA